MKNNLKFLNVLIGKYGSFNRDKKPRRGVRCEGVDGLEFSHTELHSWVMSKVPMDNQCSRWAGKLLDLKRIEIKKIFHLFSSFILLFILLN